MKIEKKKHFILQTLVVVGILIGMHANGQSVSFDLKTSPNIDFTFNTIDKCVNGIIKPHALDLNVNVTGAQWDLYVGATTTAAGSWNVLTSYSTSGITPPPVNILQARMYNSSSTQLTGGGFFPVNDIATPTYVIGSSANDPGVNCSDPSPVGTNQPGDYTSDPGCYRFRVDLKLVPGLIYRPGFYSLRVDFILIEDL